RQLSLRQRFCFLSARYRAKKNPSLIHPPGLRKPAQRIYPERLPATGRNFPAMNFSLIFSPNHPRGSLNSKGGGGLAENGRVNFRISIIKAGFKPKRFPP